MPKLQLRRHPQTATLLLAIYRSETDPANPLPRLPPEIWEIILYDYTTTPHPVFGTPMPLLTRFPPTILGPDEDEEYDDQDSDIQPVPTYTRTLWRHLPQHIRRRWTANAKAGVFLHLMNNQTQIRASRAIGTHWPLHKWTSYSLLQTSQRLTAKHIARRLRTHCVSDEEAQDLGRTLSYDLDDGEFWRILALTMQHQHAINSATAIARSQFSAPRPYRNSAAPKHRRTSRRLDCDPQLDTPNQLAHSTPLKPPLGISTRECFSVPMLRHLAKGLCPDDLQPPTISPTTNQPLTAPEIIRHIFQHSN